MSDFFPLQVPHLTQISPGHAASQKWRIKPILTGGDSLASPLYFNTL